MKIRGLFFEDSSGHVWVDSATRASVASCIEHFRETPFTGYEQPRVVRDAALAIQLAVAPGVPLTLKRFIELVSCFELIKADWFHNMADTECRWRRRREPPEVAFVFNAARADALLCEARAQLLDFMAADPSHDFRAITMLLRKSNAFHFIAASLATRSRVLHVEDARALAKYVRSHCLFGSEDGRPTVLGEALALYESAAPTVLECVRMQADVEAELCRRGLFLHDLLAGRLGAESAREGDDALVREEPDLEEPKGEFHDDWEALDGDAEASLDASESVSPTERRYFPDSVTVHALASVACELLVQFLEEAVDADLEETADGPH